jgi:membrane-bound serine protease (ClpP class)
MKLTRLRAWVSLGLMLCGAAGIGVAGVAAAAAPAAGPVVVVPIKGTVDEGMAHLVQRAVDEANGENAAAIVLDINSGGGLVDAGESIRDAIYTARMPVIAYVNPNAFSAAALIALSANRIVMAPGSSIGAAEPLPPYNDTKHISAFRAEFESTALRNHHNATVAGAMVDKNVDIPDFKRTGTILTLNTDDARRAGIADATAPTLDAALAEENVTPSTRSVEDYTWAEQLARFATNPLISTLLLSIGGLGLLIEMQTMHGIAGIIGIGALALFFGSHVYAGFSNGLVIGLAVLGVFGILWELHVVPGHGFPGVLGAAALLAATLLAFGIPFFFIAVESLATALVVTVIVFSLFVRAVPENAWMARLALASNQGPDFVTSSDFTDLRGQIGTAASFLRPAGIASIDGRRIDVLTEGEFIPQGTTVRVTRVEGARIFVEAVNLPSYT